MAELKSSLEALGLDNVRTYLQSGNVVFDAEGDDPHEHASAIQARIAGELGHHVDVLVIRCEEMQRIASSNPFLSIAGVDEKWLHATFLFQPASESDFEKLEPPAGQGERATLAGQVVFLHLPNGYGRTKLSNAFFERALGTPATTRNWKTVMSLADLCQAR